MPSNFTMMNLYKTSFVFCFGDMPNCARGLLLTLHLGITPGRLGGLYGVS